MYRALAPGMINIRNVSLADTLALAQRFGYGGIAFDVREAADLADHQGIDHIRGLFANAGQKAATFGLPVSWRDDAKWQDDLKDLPRLARVARDLGCDRCNTWLPSGSNERHYDDNFEWHVARFQPIAQALRDAGCRLGLEYIGTPSFREQYQHPFISDLDGLVTLANAIGTGNVGVMLDSWHLYMSGGGPADLERLRVEDIVVVHVNDAPAGLQINEQIDTVRALPMETGVLDVVSLLEKLKQMSYDGPVLAEPFSKRINDVASSDPNGALEELTDAMTKLWRAAGLE